MADRGWSDLLRKIWAGPTENPSRVPGRKFRPTCDAVEARCLLTASLAPIADVVVSSGTGFQVPLQGGPNNQTYTVSSSSSTVGATITQGKFLQIGVTHQAANANDISFSGTMTFQLFDDLTPLTTSRIEQLVNQGFYTSPTAGNNPATGQPYPSKNWHRIANNFPGTTDFIVQGGSVNGDGTGSVNQPGFPFANEILAQLQFNGTGQLAMANSGPNTNDSQFFVTTGSPTSLNNNYTIFGQLVAGQDILQKMTQVATTPLSGGLGTTPINPILFSSTTLSTVNPNSVIHIDTANSAPGTSSTVTVTTTDSTDGSTATQTFRVLVPGDTQSVRTLSNTLVVTPPPRRGAKAVNNINITQSNGTIQVMVNGILDTNQPTVDSLDQIVVYGSKANDRITVSPDVTLPTVLDGGHGGRNRIKAGGGPAIEHGWFGTNVLIGGTKRDLLIGRQGRVQFRPSPRRDTLYVGDPRLNLTYKNHTPQPAKGKFYHFQGKQIVPGL